MKDKDLFKLVLDNAKVNKEELRNKILSTPKQSSFKKYYNHIPALVAVCAFIIFASVLIVPYNNSPITTVSEQDIIPLNVSTHPNDGQIVINEALKDELDMNNDDSMLYTINVTVYSNDMEEYKKNFKYNGKTLDELYDDYDKPNSENSVFINDLSFTIWNEAVREAEYEYCVIESEYLKSLNLEVVEIKKDSPVIKIVATKKQLEALNISEGKSFVFDLALDY